MLFPSGYIIDASDLTLDDMQVYAKAWDVQLSLLGKGNYKGMIKALHTPNIQIGFTMHSLPVLIKGTFPKETILLFFFHKGTAGSVYLDHKISIDEVVIGQEGEEIDFSTAQACNVITIAVEKHLFKTFFENYFHCPLSSIMLDKKIILKEDHIEESISFFLSIIFKWGGEEDKLLELEKQILKQLFDAIDIRKTETTRKKFDASLIKRKLNEYYRDDVLLENLTKELKISKRLLFQTFKDYYGVTPNQYLLSLRLNEIHKVLQKANNNEVTISEIASKYGFKHMSYFTRTYKNMYNKLPSETLKSAL